MIRRDVPIPMRPTGYCHVYVKERGEGERGKREGLGGLGWREMKWARKIGNSSSSQGRLALHAECLRWVVGNVKPFSIESKRR